LPAFRTLRGGSTMRWASGPRRQVPNATIVVQRDEITNAFWPPKAYGKNSEPKLLFCDARPKIPLLGFLSTLSIFYRLPPTR
jgi:hypothetical protein